jgi:hypothetical protein
MSAVQQMLMTVGQGVTVSIDDAFAFNGVFGAASYQLAADGNINVSPFGFLSPWISKPSASSLFEGYMTLDGVSFISSTGAPLDEWINLGTSPEWSFAGFASGTATCILNIRRASAPAILLDSAIITFEYIGSFA